MKIPFIYKFALLVSCLSNAIAWFMILSDLAPLVALKVVFVFVLIVCAVLSAINLVCQLLCKY